MLSKIKQYGIKNSLIRAIKYILRSIGIRYEEYLYCVQKIPDLSSYSLILPAGFTLKKTNLEDYIKSRGLKFEESKIDLFRKRFNSNSYKAYGIIKDENLVYSCWISLRNLEMPGIYAQESLNIDEGLLVDALCHQDYRGLGLHSKMNTFRLNELQKEGKKFAIAVILKENIPARKSQFKVGFTCNEMIYVKKIGKKTNIKRVSKKIALYND